MENSIIKDDELHCPIYSHTAANSSSITANTPPSKGPSQGGRKEVEAWDQFLLAALLYTVTGAAASATVVLHGETFRLFSFATEENVS